jgi:tRNA (mo5U34)-methyltransferase
MDPAEIRRRVGEIRWYHTIDLGNGIVTPGVDPSASRLPKLRFPADMTGRTALDIGAWDGFFSFELAREVLGSSVEDRELEVLDLSPETVGVFDVVLFAGVLYHLPNPLLALERVASVTGDLLILETQVDLVRERRPAMAFYPGSDLNRDASN